MTEQTSKESVYTFTEATDHVTYRIAAAPVEYHRSPEYRAYTNHAEGIKNPRWREQIILGQNATTPFEGYSYKIESEPYSTIGTCYPKPSAPSTGRESLVVSGTQRFTHPSYTEGLVAGVPLGVANTAALSRLVEDIRDQHASFKGSTWLAELSSTIRGLRNPAKALRKGTFDYLETVKRYGKRWSKSGRKAALDALTGTYLEYTYGITPLLADIDDIKSTIKESYKDGQTQRIWATGYGEDSGLLTKQLKYTSNYYSTLGCPGVNRRTHYFSSVEYRSMLGYTIAGGQVRDLGFTPREWLPALWEVIPWSFVVDYFINVDDIITGLSYIGSNVRFTNKTTRQIWFEDYQNRGYFYRGSKFSYEYDRPTFQGSGGKASLEVKLVKRSEYSGSLIPPPAFSLPGSGRKWLNLAALATANRHALRSLKP